MPTSKRLGFGALAGLLLLPVVSAPAGPQERPQSAVVSNRISVSSGDAALHLELADDSELEIVFRSGDVVVDGETVGEYDPGAELETAWRSLLGDAVALSDGPLARALREWEPPAGVEGDALDLARRIDRTLEERLSVRAPETPAARQTTDRQPSVLRDLLLRSDHLKGLAEALEGLSLGDLQIRVDEDVFVGADEEIEGTLVVVDGDLDVAGQIRGDVVLTDGELRVREGGHISGTVRLVNARIFREGGEIGGDVRNVSPDEAAVEGESLEDLRDRIRTQVREEVRDELRSELRRELRRDRSSPGVFAPLRNVGRGVAGLLQNLVSLAIAGVLAVIVIHFFSGKLEIVADSVRRSPGRAGVVGVAGTFLLLPVWVLGMVALVISIIGIPALLAWIPLFPLAACLAAAFGYLAVARVIGEWVAQQRFQGLDFLRPSNTLHTVLAGLAALLLPFAAANVVSMAGHWLEFVEGLLMTVGVLAGIAAVAVGFGAVLLTRAGRRPEYAPTPDPYDDVRWPEEPEAESPGPEAEWDDLERSARRRGRGEPPSEPGPDEGPSGDGEAEDEFAPEGSDEPTEDDDDDDDDSRERTTDG